MHNHFQIKKTKDIGRVFMTNLTLKEFIFNRFSKSIIEIEDHDSGNSNSEDFTIIIKQNCYPIRNSSLQEAVKDYLVLIKEIKEDKIKFKELPAISATYNDININVINLTNLIIVTVK